MALLSARHDAGGGLSRVDLTVPPELARTYTAPGQYIVVTSPSGAGDGYFVLGGALGVETWELLIRKNGGASDELLDAPLGATFEVSAALGAGFPVAAAGARPLVVAAVASALAMARPIMTMRIESAQARSTFLFVGLRAPTDLPIADELASWCAQGVSVVLCLSRSELEHHPEVLPAARRTSGYVQTALVKAVAAGDVPSGALVVGAGPSGMLTDLGALTEAGLRTLEVLTNV